ncbi:dipeptidase [Tenacibaculum sp. 190524A02b]|uniref:dipeptidase n=1 Tax=Tenacibaculum vairaonense TaxID=3137860 RepID=UPI0032B14004
MKRSKRRTFIKTMGLTTIGLTLSSNLTSCQNNKSKKSYLTIDDMEVNDSLGNIIKLTDYSKKTVQLVKEASCIDMLSSYKDFFHKRNNIPLSNHWSSIPNSFTREDHSFVMNCGVNVFGWGSMKPTYESMLQFIADQNSIIASNPDYFLRIDTKKRLESVNKSGKIGMLITNQNSNHFRTLDDIKMFYGLGQRVSQLTYNDKNRLGCGAFVEKDTGITNYGKQVVQRMNEVGMAVDVSHCGDKTTLDAIGSSSKPVLITHGACRALAKGVTRAKTNEAIKALAKSGGVIGIPILRFMISNNEPVTIDHFFNHIDHIIQMVGVEHVGIGSDQGLYTEDYGEKSWRKLRLENAPSKYQTHTNKDFLLTIEKLNHPYRIYDIAEGLIKKGYTDEHVKMVLGNNFKRVLIEIFKH